MLQTLLTVQLALTGYLAGLICVIQWVHYPLSRHIDPIQWPAYQAAHMNRMFLLVGPAMVAELLLAGVLLSMDGTRSWAWANAACVAVVWAVTVLVHAPLHGQLAAGYDASLIERMVAWNWPRTVAWLSKLLVATGWLLVQFRGVQPVS
jgi:hypothetical protein